MSVTLEHDSDITRDRTVRSIDESGGARPDSLMSVDRPDVSPWRNAVDEMLRWKTCIDLFDPDDQPNDAVVDTALGYASDQIDDPDGASPPCSIVPSGGGHVTMEWNEGPWTVIIEFTGRGEAEYTRFKDGKVECSYLLKRNPRSRALERRG